MTKNKTNSQQEDKTTNHKSTSQSIENNSAIKYQYCSQPSTVERVFDPKVEDDRQRLIRIFSYDKKWLNGTVLHYYFFDTTP